MEPSFQGLLLKLYQSSTSFLRHLFPGDGSLWISIRRCILQAALHKRESHDLTEGSPLDLTVRNLVEELGSPASHWIWFLPASSLVPSREESADCPRRGMRCDEGKISFGIRQIWIWVQDQLLTSSVTLGILLTVSLNFSFLSLVWNYLQGYPFFGILTNTIDKKKARLFLKEIYTDIK